MTMAPKSIAACAWSVIPAVWAAVWTSISQESEVHVPGRERGARGPSQGIPANVGPDNKGT